MALKQAIQIWLDMALWPLPFVKNRRIIVVVNGLSSMQERADEPAKLIEWAYREYGLYSFLNPSESVGAAKVWLGVAPTVAVMPEKTVSFSLARAAMMM